MDSFMMEKTLTAKCATLLAKSAPIIQPPAYSVEATELRMVKTHLSANVTKDFMKITRFTSASHANLTALRAKKHLKTASRVEVIEF
jgi:hypothetical protein